MEKTQRNTLRNHVTDCRKALEQGLRATMEGHFGVYPSGTVDALAKLPHLTPTERDQQVQLAQTLAHLRAQGAEPADAVTTLVRAVAFTHLNRLCAYKMAERRGILRETVSRGPRSSGLHLYLGEDAATATSYDAGDIWEAYRRFLTWTGQVLAREVPLLFAPADPANWLFPREQQFAEVIDLLNSPELEEVWDEDETLGWVYQYFTPKEQRDEARKASPAPRNSYELSFRNQFYTPRYVVEFLTANTLGRLWYEMRRGQTALATQCPYIIRQRHEVWLAPGQTEPVPFTPTKPGPAAQDFAAIYTRPNPDLTGWHDIARYAITFDGYGYASAHIPGDAEPIAKTHAVAHEQGDLWQVTGEWRGTFEDLRLTLFFHQRRLRHQGRDPDGAELATLHSLYRAICTAWDREIAHIPARTPRDPRELTVLDPACGSGHFLLYAFDLLLTIYGEAWDDPDVGPALRCDHADRAAYDVAVPGLILRHNLHGIDIDPRAVQLAGLALWLRAQRHFAEREISPAQRPPLPPAQIACAVAMPPETALRQHFLDALQPTILAQVVEPLWAALRLAPEMGSLLQPETLLRQTIAQAKAYWLQHRIVQVRLFEDADAAPQQLALNYSGVTDASFFETEAQPRAIEALHQLAALADAHDITPRLFSDDAERSLAFVDALLRRYDVVLMNPPFGEPSIPTRLTIDALYPRTKNDLYAAFVERGLSLLKPQGRLGAITSRTGFFLATFRRWREEILLSEAHMVAMADLGAGVLDSALVETAAYILEKQS
ncbi:MAG: hypothetical protein H0X24_02645 [Ktedonobacterales bacterium]|nr:hypothetical protein [Ktedonobacterales bacterium]